MTSFGFLVKGMDCWERCMQGLQIGSACPSKRSWLEVSSEGEHLNILLNSLFFFHLSDILKPTSAEQARVLLASSLQRKNFGGKHTVTCRTRRSNKDLILPRPKYNKPGNDRWKSITSSAHIWCHEGSSQMLHASGARTESSIYNEQ